MQARINRLRRGDGLEVCLEPKAMDLLVYLCQRPGCLCTRRELLDEVWGDVVVGEEVLTQAVSKLRRAFADDPRSPRYIETISRRGYRLVADIDERPAAVGVEGDDPRRGVVVRWAAVRSVAAAAVLVTGVIAVFPMLIDCGTRGTAMPPFKVVPITTRLGVERNPALSPDGARIVYTADDDVYWKETDAGPPVRLTSHGGSNPTWSRSGTHVAYVSPAAAGGEILVVPAAGGEPRRLVPARGVAGRISWSPDSSTVVCSERTWPYQSSQIVLYEVSSGRRVEITPPAPAGQDATDPVYSPDGSLVAYAQHTTAGFVDLRVATPSGHVRCISSGQTRVYGFDWARDGTAIILSADRDRSRAVWSVNVGSGRRTWIPGLAPNVCEISVARRAARVAYTSCVASTDIISLRRDRSFPATPVNITESSARDKCPSSSASGRIAFVSDRSGTDEVWICEPDGAGPIRLTSLERGVVIDPKWSPDETRIAFSANPHGTLDLFVVAVGTGELTRLTQGQANVRILDWSKDGEWIYFGSDRDGVWAVWKLSTGDLDWTSAVRVTGDEGNYGQEAPDGHDFWYSRSGRVGVWVSKPGADGRSMVAERLGGPAGRARWETWVRCGTGLAAIDLSGAERTLIHYDPHTGAEHRIVLDCTVLPEWLACSGNADTVLYVSERIVSSDLVLVEGF